jgi:hypothetical protein
MTDSETDMGRPAKPVDPLVALVTDKLKEKYDGQGGPFSEEEVAAAVQAVVDELRDRPVQTFVPLIAENKARDELQERAEHTED